MAMEATLFIGEFPKEIPISSGFPVATFDYWRKKPGSPIFWLPINNTDTLNSSDVPNLIWTVLIRIPTTLSPLGRLNPHSENMSFKELAPPPL